MSLNISYIIIILIVIALTIEDFKTKYVDIRLCMLLFIAVIFNVYINKNISLVEYFLNFIYGLFFMLFIYVLGLKTLIINPNKSNKINMDNDNNDIFSLGFIPSFSIACIIYHLISNNNVVTNLIKNSDLFLSSCGNYLAIFLIIYIILKLIYIYYENIKEREKIIIITGFGDGDVIVLTILTGIISLNIFIFIFSIALIIHVLFYIIYFFLKGMKF